MIRPKGNTETPPFRAKRPRYPKKRSVPRILLVLALPVLLVLLTVGTVTIFSKDNDSADGSLVREDISAIRGLSEEESYPSGRLAPSVRFDSLLLEKSARRLTAYSKGAPVRVYLVALGTNPVGHKRFEGDRKTPEGKYTINDKNPNSSYYKNLGVSYPNKQDIAYARAQKKSPGGLIKIHGLAPEFASIGPAHRLTDWTFGCIAVTNTEMEELYQRTPVGTPIEIIP